MIHIIYLSVIFFLIIALIIIICFNNKRYNNLRFEYELKVELNTRLKNSSKVHWIKIEFLESEIKSLKKKVAFLLNCF